MKNIAKIGSNGEFEPRRQTIDSAGYDIYATEDISVTEEFKVVDTGVIFDGTEVMITTLHQIVNPKSGKLLTRVNIVKNWYAQVHPRSSMAINKGLQLANIGIIDQDYRDTIKVAVRSDKPFLIKKGDRFAQMIFMPYLINVKEIRPSKQREGGIGSTDKKLEEF